VRTHQVSNVAAFTITVKMRKEHLMSESLELDFFSQVFMRVTQYDGTNTAECDVDYLAAYDISTAAADVRHKACSVPLSGWLSGDERALLHLHGNSINSLPNFTIHGNIYMKGELIGCNLYTAAPIGSIMRSFSFLS